VRAEAERLRQRALEIMEKKKADAATGRPGP
jgi:hypothetical protein